MYWKDAATLIAESYGKDADGYSAGAGTPTETEVFVNVEGVKRSEFYAAKQTGLDITIVFVVLEAEYSGQPYIRHDGTLYKVERTFPRPGERVELNCSKARKPDTEEAGV